MKYRLKMIDRPFRCNIYVQVKILGIWWQCNNIQISGSQSSRGVYVKEYLDKWMRYYDINDKYFIVVNKP